MPHLSRIVFLIVLAPLAVAQTTAPATTQPIYTGKSPAGELLKKWWAEGTAAGNIGDLYDNRDRTHSELNRGPFPQLGKYVYPKEVLDRKGDWAAQNTLLPGIVFGNSSTSASVTSGGSNPRSYYVNPRGLAFLFTQYTRNNLYIYPEHQDHDPGHNGVGGGYGDVYPTNTPYLIISQGSSGSDQPFMKAVPMTLAAFRPDVKQKLAKGGLLMPTVQMILRSCANNVKAPEDYLTGAAHPTVFEGGNVDELKMVQLAHEISEDKVPPIALLKVIEEDTFKNGVDYFEPEGVTEVLADTPCAVSRIWRATAGKRRMVVSAEQSGDLNKRPLKFHWSVLRGDEKRVTIKPLNEAGSRVEITVHYPERRAVWPGSAIESNRVDIGAFVNNGAYWSAPSFVTFFGLDWEGRKYDERGRVAEVGYGVGRPRVTVKDWRGVLDGLTEAEGAPGISPDLIAGRLKKEDLAALKPIAAGYRAKLVTKDDKGMKQLLEERQSGMSASVKQLIEGALNEAIAFEMLTGFTDVEGMLTRAIRTDAKLKAAYGAIRAQLVRSGVAKADGELVSLTFAQGKHTAWELVQCQRYNADVLAQLLLPGLVTADKRANLVDPRLATAKAWRDVYKHGADGKVTGWTRLGLEKAYEFDAEGRVVVEGKAATVKYEAGPMKGFGPMELKMVVGEAQ